ncbi:Uncharacterised protein [Serratia quinivorans]|uniref:Uncharacterized protein n=1 Tax=Serratia quinivorans TaxID=137545 RepID=A0A380AED6_9GAMM|nr:Uncharacterised protein [Serratia quinivorans]
MPVRIAPSSKVTPNSSFETYSRADKFGQICGHGNNFCLNPISPHRRTRETIANMLRQVFTRGNAQFGGQQLDQHRHHIGPHHHPQQGITKRGTGLDIGSEITGVNVADSRDKCGAHQGKFDLPG